MLCYTMLCYAMLRYAMNFTRYACYALPCVTLRVLLCFAFALLCLCFASLCFDLDGWGNRKGRVPGEPLGLGTVVKLLIAETKNPSRQAWLGNN